MMIAAAVLSSLVAASAAGRGGRSFALPALQASRSFLWNSLSPPLAE